MPLPRLIECATQADLDAVGPDDIAVVRSGFFDASGSATVRAYDSATVTAYGSATVTAYGSATVRASGSATVRASGSATVRAYDSATVRAYDSATVRAYDSATVRAYGSATVTASGSVAVHDHNPDGRTSIAGGVVIPIRPPANAEEWCAYYGVELEDGVARLFKGVDEDFQSAHGADYSPGSCPAAPDWEVTAECGHGLHFSPRAFMTRSYCTPARFVACGVRLDEMVLLGDKVKAPRVVTPCVEVDEDGVAT